MTVAEITVGMPCHNNAATLARAIASVRAQTETNWRLILSDDLSSDDSWEICQAAARSDQRITARRQEARRHFLNFSDLLDGVDTPYFAWLSADDYWAPDFLRLGKATLDASPEAISALPRCVYFGPGAREHPPTPSIEGTSRERIGRYLSGHPGGTRMYGLFRTAVLKDALPSRIMNAWDWYLMVGVLKAGAQIEVSVPLLFREHTDWMRYSEMVEEIYSSRVFRRFPALDMSLQLLRNGKIPRANLMDLIGLNLRKHEEYLAVMHPDAFRRRLPLFRRLGMPISTDPGRIAAISERLIDEAPNRRNAAIELMRSEARRGSTPAERVLDRLNKHDGLVRDPMADAGTREASLPASSLVGRALPPLTAIITCRNAAGMLGRQLKHLHQAGTQVIVIDHGSSDRTRAVAEAHIGDPVAEIVDEPFDGVFDLTRQLRLKKQIIAGLEGGWVLHVDVDEFLDPPAGQTLRRLARKWSASNVKAANCEERLFLPAREDEIHDAESFERSMRRYVVMAERDPKQRFFRADAPLETWMRTGGHTICRDAAWTAPEPLRLRHYLGLSLDDIRAKYYARVFARGDIGKYWHSSRLTASLNEIVAPDDDLLFDPDAPAPRKTLRKLPIFASLPPPAPGAILAAKADLLIVSAPSQASREAVMTVRQLYPGLRIEVTEDCLAALRLDASVPLLNLLEHPVAALGAASGEAEQRCQASDWVQRIAVSRQVALAPGRHYCEMRVEDAANQPALSESAVRDLVLTRCGRPERGFVTTAAPQVEQPDWPPVIRRIAGPLAGDISYL